ncbi:beta-lactamase/transpeptidase-like protein [Nemania sp. FL0916]|nr:beta-lactamase/transpeptidase-like protein [Nemania sp. FL0916]
MFGHLRVSAWLLLFQAITSSHAKLNCPLYGLGYPKPKDLSIEVGIGNTKAALDSVFGQYIDNANNTGSDRFSYSVNVFTANEDTPLWTHYWTAKNLESLNTTGVRTIDGDTVFRIGSLTKIFTMLTFLAEVGDASWNEPIAKYIPEVAALMEDGADTSHSLTTPDWGAITIGSLASQISGLMRDYSLLGELTQSANQSSLMAIGLPGLDGDEIPPCGSYPVCDRAQFFAGLKRLPPSFSPFVTPAYSDIGYVLLSYALESMTGRPFRTSFEEKLVKPLNLTHTFYTTPNDSLGVIPGGRYLTTWAFDMGNESPTGGIYSSTTDMAKVGRAILKSTLLPWPVTHRWLRPVTLSSDPYSAVGSPWGVRRISQPHTVIPRNASYDWTTTFNKLGSIGKYSALLAVIPELDIGFSIAAAGDIPASLVLDIADTLSDTYLQLLPAIAQAQANSTYFGEYRSADASINSTLFISVNNTLPGLGVGPWISNGTDMLSLAVALGQNITQDYWERIVPSARLYPTGLWDPLPDGGRRVGFKAVFEDLSAPDLSLADTHRPFTTDCSTWIYVGGIVYGSRPLDSFIFDVAANGTVLAVENAALRNRMVKVV